MIHRLFIALFLALLILGPTGCGPSAEELRIQELEQEKQQLTDEKRKEEQETERWKLYTFIAACSGGILLFFGAGLGSSAKKEAKTQSQDARGRGEDEE